MVDVEKTNLLNRTRLEATDGRHEWYKTTQYYDSKPHRDQHDFPPVVTESGE